MVNVVNQRMEVNDIGHNNNTSTSIFHLKEQSRLGDIDGEDVKDENGAQSNLIEAFSSIYQKDAYLLFRALCKLSMKGSSDDAVGYNDNILLQNK